jgi:hypothetical protein
MDIAAVSRWSLLFYVGAGFYFASWAIIESPAKRKLGYGAALPHRGIGGCRHDGYVNRQKA